MTGLPAGERTPGRRRGREAPEEVGEQDQIHLPFLRRERMGGCLTQSYVMRHGYARRSAEIEQVFDLHAQFDIIDVAQDYVEYGWQEKNPNS
jgi:radical SAM superfamily enzyme with C-terminal helix-hairpin-helix motif